MLAARRHVGVEAVATQVEVGDRLLSRVELQAVEAKLLGDGLGVRRAHEDVLEDGGGVSLLKTACMKSADAEKRRPLAPWWPNRGEVLAGRSRLPQDEALLVRVLLANGSRHRFGVVLGAPSVAAREAWRP